MYKEGDEVFLCYGERANSFLIVEYGFAIRDNWYDFVRLRFITRDIIMKTGASLGLPEETFATKEVF